MGSVIQVLALAAKKQGAGDSFGDASATAVTVNIPVSKILKMEVDTTTYSGCNSRTTVQGAGNIPDVYYSDTTLATILSTINTTS